MISRKKKKVLFIGLAVIILLGLSLAGYVYFQFNQMKYVKIDKTNEALGINQKIGQNTSINSATTPSNPSVNPTTMPDNQIINIALFGVDRRNENENGRSDTMMILTIDYKHKKLKLTSLMRDLQVPVEGHGLDKLNSAYSYGGAPLAIKTINQDFGTDIHDYVTVDFFSLEKIVDAIGGVEIDVQPQEVSYINECITEVAGIEKTKPLYLTHGGTQLLNGQQALGYARIRHIGNGDFERTERQRVLLTALIKKIEAQGVTKFPQIASSLFPYVETSIDKTTALQMSLEFLKSGITTFEQERFPVDGYWKADMSTGIYYLKVDLAVMKQQIQDYIYRDIVPGSKET